jgi:hypothetical protein
MNITISKGDDALAEYLATKPIVTFAKLLLIEYLDISSPTQYSTQRPRIFHSRLTIRGGRVDVDYVRPTLFNLDCNILVPVAFRHLSATFRYFCPPLIPG